MTAGTIGDFLPTAVAVAISPVPMAAVIVMLLSERAGRNGVAFVLGWVVGLAGVGALVIAFDLGATDDGDGSSPVDVAKLVLGVGFVLVASNSWRTRPREGEPRETPGWVTRIDGLSTPIAFGVGWGFGTFAPKNLSLATTGSSEIASAMLSPSGEAAALALFVAIASLGVAAPVVVHAVVPGAGPALDRARGWLIRNAAAVKTVVFLTIGVVLVRDAALAMT